MQGLPLVAAPQPFAELPRRRAADFTLALLSTGTGSGAFASDIAVLSAVGTSPLTDMHPVCT